MTTPMRTILHEHCQTILSMLFLGLFGLAGLGCGDEELTAALEDMERSASTNNGPTCRMSSCQISPYYTPGNGYRIVVMFPFGDWWHQRNCTRWCGGSSGSRLETTPSCQQCLQTPICSVDEFEFFQTLSACQQRERALPVCQVVDNPPSPPWAKQTIFGNGTPICYQYRAPVDHCTRHDQCYGPLFKMICRTTRSIVS
jgi:hypothetical protein